MKLWVDANSNSAPDGGEFISDPLAYNNFYAYHSIQPLRNWNSTLYRYGGAGGQEKDDEIRGAGNTYTAKDWDYSNRTGIRSNKDPKGNSWESPYACFGDNPIWKVDPDGQFAIPIHAQITDNAAKLNKLTSTQTFFLVQGARAADMLGFSEEWHFDNKANYKEVSAQWKGITQRINDRPAWDFYGLGADLHNVQDFYSHSNYVELYVDYYKKSNGGAMPAAIPIYDVGVKDAEFNKVLEGSLKTGTFDVGKFIVNEKIRGKDMGADSHQKMNKDNAKGALGKLAKDVAQKHSEKIISEKQQQNDTKSKSENE
jgi:hypothetical protein